MSVFDFICMRDKVGGRGRRKERKLEQREQVVYSFFGFVGVFYFVSLIFFFVFFVVIVSQWQQEFKEKVVFFLLFYLFLFQLGNTEVKSEYMRLLQKVLVYLIESNVFIEESRQLFFYVFIYSVIILEDRNALVFWLSYLEERLVSSFRSRFEFIYYSRQGLDEWGGFVELGFGEVGLGWQDKLFRENGYVFFYLFSFVSSVINSIGSNVNVGEGVGVLGGYVYLKRVRLGFLFSLWF